MNQMQTTTSSYELNMNLHESSFPVIKIDFEGTILYANKAAFGLIKDWGCMGSRKVPANVLNQYPQLLDRKANSETEIVSAGRSIKFNVIAFDEAGYTGLYGYDMRMTA